jgi:hypothetical protein
MADTAVTISRADTAEDTTGSVSSSRHTLAGQTPRHDFALRA